MMTATIKYSNKKIEYHLGGIARHIRKIASGAGLLDDDEFSLADGTATTFEYSHEKIEYHLARFFYYIKKIGIENLSKYIRLKVDDFFLSCFRVDLTVFGDDVTDLTDVVDDIDELRRLHNARRSSNNDR